MFTVFSSDVLSGTLIAGVMMISSVSTADDETMNTAASNSVSPKVTLISKLLRTIGKLAMLNVILLPPKLGPSDKDWKVT